MPQLNNISSLASVVNMFAGGDPVKASLIPLNDDGSEDTSNERAFQYFPEQITDNKGVNYATKNIPGGSHPLYQFVNGGDRQISFTAIFTSDEDPAPATVLSVLQGGFSFGVPDILNATGKGQNLKKHNVPVQSAVIWLRSFIYPTYVNNTVKPPPVVRIYLPNSGIHGTTKGGALVLDSIDCLMTQCDVTYERFYRGGSQRISVVQLTMVETIQVSSSWKFADRSGFVDVYSSGTSANGAVPQYTNRQTRVTPNIFGIGSNSLVDQVIGGF